MTQSGKPLWGNSKDAYFRRVLRSEAGVGAAASERLLRRLKEEVVQVRLREAAGVDAAEPWHERPTEASSASQTSTVEVPTDGIAVDPGGFNPFTPNVVVVVRTAGRDGALAALAGIERVEHLRLLAREQQLSIEAGIDSLPEIRRAIVAAAERRIANRRAAAR